MRVLTAVWRDPRHLEPFRAALPQAGVSGTLANHMKDTPAAGRVWAKTGSMSNVRSLSGYVMTLDDEPLVFAFMATGFRVPMSQIDATMNQALLRLVRYPRESHEESSLFDAVRGERSGRRSPPSSCRRRRRPARPPCQPRTASAPRP